MTRPYRRLGLVVCAAVACLAALGAAGTGLGAKPKPKPPLPPNTNIVIGQLNLWYYGNGPNGGFEAYDGSGKPTSRVTPLAGHYHSSDPTVVRRQIAWAANNGVDVFSIEWLAPRGEPGSIEDNIDDAFLRAPNLCRIRWLIFLDFNLHLTWRKIDYSQGVDFDNPAIRSLFVSDLVHLATKYFKQKQYFRLGGRPVVYIWATWNFTGDVAGAVAEARQKVRALGYDVYLVGDEVAADRFDPAHAALWDATSSFIPFLMPGAPPIHSLPEAATFVDGAFSAWQQKLAGLTVAGRSTPVAFQPGFTPQYDDVLFRTANGIPNPTSIQAKSQAEVESLARVSLAHETPVPGTGQRIVWLNTWNNWAETTTVEPTAASGPKYPAGNYQFDMLNAVKDVFGARTYGTAVTCPAVKR
jgi:hypothetical protein